MSSVKRRLALGFLAGVASVGLMTPAFTAGSAVTTETVADAKADAIVGAHATGANWTVQSPVHSDGFMHIFALQTPYGNYEVSGDQLLSQRLSELQAVETLEKMSKTRVFVDAAGHAGLAPLRFGRDFVTAPLDTTDRLVSGVANMFDKVDSEIDNHSASRDSFVESVTGIQKAKRELAFTLGVDPYSEFPPLAEGLTGIAQMMALGDISINAAFSAIPGGAGIAVSATSTAGTLSEPLRDKSSAEIAGLVTTKLKALGVSEEQLKAFFKDTAYSPADQLAIADALTTLKAKDTGAFIARASTAETADVAKFQRYRVELMAKENERLGTLVSFETVSGFAINRDKKGDLVAVFPFDEVVWTEIASRAFGEMSADIAKRKEAAKPIFATTARVSPTAEAQLKKLGWQIVRL